MRSNARVDGSAYCAAIMVARSIVTRRVLCCTAALLALAPRGMRAAEEPAPKAPRRPTPYGFRVEPLDAAAARELGVGAGLRVVYSIGLGYASGLRLGDVIVELDGRAVTTEDNFWSDVDARDGRVTLQVWREGRRLALRLAP